MSGSIGAEGVWRRVDYDAAWAPFYEAFEFRASFYERQAPAIRLRPDCLVVDLSEIFATEGLRFAAGEVAVNAAALRAFAWLAGDEDLVALDWQHPAYRYTPGRHALSDLDWRVPVFPNGDYYAHMSTDLRWGTFGHPWQQSLCIWGDELVESLRAELLTWLPRHPQSIA